MSPSPQEAAVALRAAAEAAGLEVEADISGLRIWVPRLRVLPQLGIMILLIASVSMALASLLSIMISLGDLAMVLLALSVGVGLSSLIARWLYSMAGEGLLRQSVVLSPHAILIRGESIPLEEIVRIRAGHGLVFLWFRLTLRSGRRLLLVRSDQPTAMWELRRLILSAQQARVQQLEAAGQDPTQPAAVPRALQSLRGTTS